MSAHPRQLSNNLRVRKSLREAYHAPRALEQDLMWHFAEAPMAKTDRLILIRCRSAGTAPSRRGPPAWAARIAWITEGSTHSGTGDFYDFLPYRDGRIAIAVGDVAGKGPAAALLASLGIGILREHAMHHVSNPAELLADLNRHLQIAGEG